MRDIKLQIAGRSTPQGSSPTENSAGSTVETEEDMLDGRKREREIRDSSSYDEEL